MLSLVLTLLIETGIDLDKVTVIEPGHYYEAPLRYYIKTDVPLGEPWSITQELDDLPRLSILSSIPQPANINQVEWGSI